MVFIGHAVADAKTGKITPKGDKRCLNPIIDNSDFVIYAKSNGADEAGHANLSTGYFIETDEFFARSRFTECVPSITPLSAENIEKAIKEAIEAEEKKSGIAAVSYEEQKEMNAAEVLDFDTLMKEVQEMCVTLANAGRAEEVVDVIENVLGPGKKVSECTKKQVEALATIKDDLNDLL